MLNDVPNLTIASGVREIGFGGFIFGALEGGVSAFELPRTRILEVIYGGGFEPSELIFPFG